MKSRILCFSALCGAALLGAMLVRPAFSQDQAMPLVPLRPVVHRQMRRPMVRPAETASSPSGVSLNYRVRRSPIFNPGGSEQSIFGAGSPDWIAVGPGDLLTPGGGVGSNTTSVSGRVSALAGDPVNANTFYVGAAGGGIWKTTDGGVTYVPLTDFASSLTTGSIAVAPSNHQILYVGTGEPNLSLDSRYGMGVLKSTDGGATWTVIPGPSNVFQTRSISKVIVHPTNPNIVYVALTWGGQSIQNLGVYKSTDGGTTWTNTTSGFITTTMNVTDLVMDPTTPNTLYVGIWDLFGRANNGIYKTTNGGATWSAAGDLSAFTPRGRITLAIAPSSPSTVYAAITNNNTSGLLSVIKSTNNGATWSKPGNAPNYLGGQGWYDTILIVNPSDANRVYAAGQVNYGAQVYGDLIGVVESTDGGATWGDLSAGNNLEIPHTDHHAFAFTANGKLLLGSDGGAWRLENPLTVVPLAHNGNPLTSNIVWTNVNGNLNTLQFTGIALHPTDPTIAYGGAQDNGTSKYTGGIRWTQVAGGDGGFTRVDQSNPTTIYHEFYGVSLQRSDDGGTTWSTKIGGINTGDDTVEDDFSPSAFYIPYILDPANQSHLLLGTDNLYESTNRGDNWTQIATNKKQGFNPGNAAIHSIGVNGSTLYVGTDSEINVSTDGGANWTSQAPGGLSGPFYDIYVNPNAAGDAIVVRGDFTGGSGGHVFRTTDSGATWTDISGNLPDQPYNAVKLDKHSGSLYVGGDDGVYYSSNFGASWTRLGSALPNVQVVDLALNNTTGILAAGTHGRGMWTYSLPTTLAQPRLLSTVSVSTQRGLLACAVTVNNTGNGDIGNVQITKVTINNLAMTGGPTNVGTLVAASSKSGGTFTHAPVSGTTAIVRIYGTSSLGNFYTALKVTLP